MYNIVAVSCCYTDKKALDISCLLPGLLYLYNMYIKFILVVDHRDVF